MSGPNRGTVKAVSATWTRSARRARADLASLRYRVAAARLSGLTRAGTITA